MSPALVPACVLYRWSRACSGGFRSQGCCSPLLRRQLRARRPGLRGRRGGRRQPSSLASCRLWPPHGGTPHLSAPSSRRLETTPASQAGNWIRDFQDPERKDGEGCALRDYREFQDGGRRALSQESPFPGAGPRAPAWGVLTCKAGPASGHVSSVELHKTCHSTRTDARAPRRISPRDSGVVDKRRGGGDTG